MAKRLGLSLGLILCLAFISNLVLADPPHSNWRDVPYMINQFPASYDPWEEWDEPLMSQWNTFSSVMTWSSNPPGTFGPGNGKNEFAGFLTDSQMNQYFGISWGGAAAMCASWGYPSGELVESDIMWNAGLSWTTDVETSLDNEQILYQRATIHELGHSFGLDDYDYKGENEGDDSKAIGYDTVMNYAWPWHVFAVGLDDAMVVQNMYPARQQNVHDVGIYGFYCTSKYSCPEAYKSTGSAARGKSFEIEGIQVSNMGNYAESNVGATFYLSEDVDISSSDVEIGSVTWGSISSRTRTIVDVELTVPSDAPTGDFYVGAVLSGVSGDALTENNAMFLPGQLRVTSGGGGDDDDDDDPPDPEDCPDFCEIIDFCHLVNELGVSSWEDCLDTCEDMSASVVYCVLDAEKCSEVEDCLGFGDDDDDDDDDDDSGACGC